mmetsp:Transcript_5464/g.16147  ORF Transcript_5464/g.16147 Transcript_5464/m.16147 type:complete len:660 (+) Transcript_5464:436-2415(+)
MITYRRSLFGLNLIFRVHGSAVYRSILPSLCGVVIYLAIRLPDQDGDDSKRNDDVSHPYALGVLIASTTFLLVFRANQGYARYWEATGAIHHMMSKWMDATSHMAIYHLQSAHYEDIKPPSYFEYPELDSMYLTRDRERGWEPTDSSERFEPPRVTSMSASQSNRRRRHVGGLNGSGSGTGKFSSTRGERDEYHSAKVIRSVNKSINTITDRRKKNVLDKHTRQERFMTDEEALENYFASDSGYGKPAPLLGAPRLDGNWGALFKDTPTATFCDPQNPRKFDSKGFASLAGGRTPPLFLQELAHLASLATAVALATLRNDTDGVESPLDFHEPGSPWPEVDPDQDEALQVTGVQAIGRVFLGFFGVARTPDERMRYTVARPLPVIGGVSDSEIQFLQMAKGPYAKTQLCWQWLSEFCIREHLAGSTGKVGPPIISRVIQFLGDGMIYYNHARKVRFIPFPFVHSQLSVLFVWMIIPVVALLMDQYTFDVWLGALLTFAVIACLAGIDEVARELESPFRNVPNELPLVTLMAQFNEALITMYAGYHPDHFWDGAKALRKGREQLEKRKAAAAAAEAAVQQQQQEEEEKKESNGDVTRNGSERLPDKEEFDRLRNLVEEQGMIIRELASKLKDAPSKEMKMMMTDDGDDDNKSTEGVRVSA